jgi:hypothetical protein
MGWNPCFPCLAHCSTTPVSCNFRGQWKAEKNMCGPVIHIPLSRVAPEVGIRGLFTFGRFRRLGKWSKFQPPQPDPYRQQGLKDCLKGPPCTNKVLTQTHDSKDIG